MGSISMRAMIVEFDGKVHHGARAMSLLARLSGTLSPLRSERVASAVLSVLSLRPQYRALKVLGRSQI